MASSTLTFNTLKEAVAGSAAAFRLTLRLEAVSPKVFPPTYEGGKYATEERIIGGQKLPCVLLDSVQSQANRMELALQDAWSGDEIELPVVSVNLEASRTPAFRRSRRCKRRTASLTPSCATARVATARSRSSSVSPTSARNSTSYQPGTQRPCSSTRRTVSCSACGTAPGRVAAWV